MRRVGGEPEPSEADIKVTRDLIRAGQLLKIELLDHVIIGAGEALVFALSWLFLFVKRAAAAHRRG